MVENTKEKGLKSPRFYINLLFTFSKVVVIIAALLFPLWSISAIWKFSQYGVKAFSIPLSDNLELRSRLPCLELLVFWVIFPILAVAGIYCLIQANIKRM
ncbi:MAG TPA: hypothetical protein PKJ37_05895 [Acidobacteriota bacterium]|nr:hypothetical protein [Acidobacteriota bacterium]HNT17410.1 hypothetical protein [Acidobacteriota bacterium]